MEAATLRNVTLNDVLEIREQHTIQKSDFMRTIPKEQVPLPTPYAILEAGYPFQEFQVTTSDGYILSLHRIPGLKGSSPTTYGPPVLLMHGLAMASTSFLALGPSNSLGYILADAGYDVWLGNFRGNTFSRKHTSLNPDSDQSFWHFSQDEMASQDIPSMIDFIYTKNPVKLIYIGYSQGGRTGLMAATNSAVCDKLKLMIVLASTGARTLTDAAAGRALVLSRIWTLLEFIGKPEIMSRNLGIAPVLGLICKRKSLLSDVCALLVSKYFGTRLKGDDLYTYRQDHLPLIFANLLDGSSARQFSHQEQLTRGVLRKFDFGIFGNPSRYGSKEAPVYDLTTVQCPVAIYWADNDPRTPKTDVDRIAAEIPNVVATTQVERYYFNHIDFIFADLAKSLVYDSIVQLMSQY
ncbi:gastric triacylglycerol lipase [Hyalella azteca]|uniref:Lipase n=1 Tax=Hyalella azteca TaxID=294128 RepID=A0A8B7P1V1_HYAAZ|nr:gastric triacylglycerol lipase [Hyalella azteca]